MTRTFRLDGKGSGLVLGPLETEVMHTIWQSGGWVAVSTIHGALARGKRQLAYSTTKTIMNNLAEKGHLRKRTAGRANEFCAVKTQEAFEQSVVGDVLKPLMRNYRNPLLAHIVSQLEDDSDVAQLERLLAEKKAGNHRE